MNVIVKTWRTFLDALFPLVCINCKKSDKKIICEPCFNTIFINEIFTEIEHEIEPKIILSGAGSYGNNALRKLIHSLKYDGLKKSSKPIAEIMIKHIKRTGLINSIDKNTIIVPIPLHKSKLKKRGFNQSELIAKIVGEKLNIPVINILKRAKNTAPQIQMKNNKEREKNIKGAFDLNPAFTNEGISSPFRKGSTPPVHRQEGGGISSPFRKGSTPLAGGGISSPPMSIGGVPVEERDFPSHRNLPTPFRKKGIGSLILIDDVYTSGTTTKEAIKVLEKLKPKRIIVLVAARADF